MIVLAKTLVIDHHFPDIVTGLRIGRNRAMPFYPPFARIVCGHRQPHIPVKAIQQRLHVSRPAADIVVCVVQIPHAVPDGVSGINCISPTAPDLEIAVGLKSESALMMARSKAGCR